MDKPQLITYTVDLIEGDPDSGVGFVSFVDRPAIERNWIALAATKQEYKFQVTSPEKRIVSGPLLIPDMQIFRKGQDGNPDYYLKFTAEAIYSTVKKFFKDGNTSNVNVMHNDSLIPNDVYMMESFITDTNRMSNPKGFEDLPNGTWFGSYKVDNEGLWQAIKAGEFMGFSIEGFFAPKPETPEESLLRKIMEVISSR